MKKKRNRRSKYKKNEIEDLSTKMTTLCSVQINELMKSANDDTDNSKAEIVEKVLIKMDDCAENDMQAVRKFAKVFWFIILEWLLLVLRHG